MPKDASPAQVAERLADEFLERVRGPSHELAAIDELMTPDYGITSGGRASRSPASPSGPSGMAGVPMLGRAQRMGAEPGADPGRLRLRRSETGASGPASGGTPSLRMPRLMTRLLPCALALLTA